MSKETDSFIRVSLTAAAFDSPPSPTQLEKDVVELFDAFKDQLGRYVHSFGIPNHDTDEIIQEVFLSLFRHLRHGRSRSNLRGWIFRVAHNLALKKIYKNQRMHSFVELDERIANLQIDLAPNPEEHMACGARHNRLHNVLRALPEQEQHCLFLRSEGLSYREIAEVLGISLGAVSNWITRSLARLGSVCEE